jgi:mannose-6-phosphate isomerase-like protein (cupin superfamily)
MTLLTRVLPESRSYPALSGADIRLLIQLPQGELTHASCRSGLVSKSSMLVDHYEMFYVIAGTGELWRKCPEYEGVVALRPGRWAAMPAGTHFQYRALQETTLVFLVAVLPRFDEAAVRDGDHGPWDPGARPQGSLNVTGQNWNSGDLPAVADYFAPDGSEIRLLADHPAGGVSHCTLPPARVSSAVRHRGVHEIWVTLGGQGELWRQDGDQSEIVALYHGVAADIPPRTPFQFRSTGVEPLTIAILTMPAWPGPAEAEPTRGHWS